MALVLVLVAGVGVIQCMFIINTIQRVFPKLRNIPAIEKTINLIQVGPIVFMALTSIWFFFLVFLPVKVQHPYTTKEGILHIFVACYLWLNMIFNYFAAMIKSPGYPPLKQEMEEDGLSCDNDATLCLKCDRIKAYDTHHCSTCGTCVLMMCHHCPFTNNCVGLRNYSYFFLFICYSVVGLLFSLYMTYDPFYHCMVYDGKHLSQLPWYPPGLCRNLGDYAVIFIPVAFMSMFSSAMLFLQSVLLLSNFSTVELLTKAQRSKSFETFFLGLVIRIQEQKKKRFQIMFLFSRENWWQFFIPSFNVPKRHMETVKLMV